MGFHSMKSRKMKVVIFATATPDIGGIGQYTQQILPHLARALSARGCEVALLLSRDSIWSISEPGVRAIRLPVDRHNRVLRVFLEHAYTPLVGWGADVFVSLESRFPVAPIGAKHSVLVVHDLYPLLEKLDPSRYPSIHTPLKQAYWSLVIRQGVNRADRLIADSDSVVDELRTVLGVREDRITRIYLGIDHERFRFRANHDTDGEIRKRYDLPNEFYLFVGGFVEKKNLRLVIQSYDGSEPGSCTMLPVVITCSKCANPLTSLIERSGKSKLFRFIGHVPDEEMPLLYAASRASICPSWHEGFGLPALEAMACGTPVVVSNRGSSPEVVEDAALIVEPDDPASLRRALREVNLQPVREALVRKGLQRAKQFSWQHTAQSTAEVILAVGGR